jgi:hypothetical protein
MPTNLDAEKETEVETKSEEKILFDQIIFGFIDEVNRHFAENISNFLSKTILWTVALWGFMNSPNSLIYLIFYSNQILISLRYIPKPSQGHPMIIPRIRVLQLQKGELKMLRQPSY